eukprot:CAMPEP_0114533902 /NCGR_PEP_ID=MMETSP0109-20121206/27518_1 /TAXON_ID=29199 /ORGANISM="Chlorarachnion reptans, Strain CCCM449" /LENGTH=110 /DNA_ID=CAMNT_0001717207 /DNA_START=287 /DNA_END=619 /DNA_ORIENTATION=-
MKELPIQKCSLELDRGLDQKLENALGSMRDPRADSNAAKAQAQAYQAWLGFYNGHKKKLGWNNDDLVRHANNFAHSIGASTPPPIKKVTAAKMGLISKGKSGRPAGLNIV